ncbi:homeobox-DDT domain protein RLT1-like isoform X5 [Durio zibethinus]|uniref:Homeobox-DDT domain protein RLT1-like isoform X5 n=1 Tax=Durio zibethinus TaxID=66656 RepID=A0A6P5XY23_DURZI|nr:homeobox-DDT domain protein RLT1-like isoform X5 [Durio zibethinus]
MSSVKSCKYFQQTYLNSGEMQTEENKVSLDVNKKRMLKTPAQIMALENFYKENRFPLDEMKAQLAVQIGLTEKQISSWFCHRRLKDKRRDESYANGRQDHSSGVIQDHGSGLRQDSCGSIKQGDYRHIDLREVESRRIYGQEPLAADLTYEHRSHQNPYDAHMEDTSSESSSSLHDQLFSESRDPYDMQVSDKLTENGALMQINPGSSKSVGYKPSGYLKVKGQIENPAITAVKKQLGRHYQEDGPVLGIEFDALPPGAFEFLRSNPVNAASIYVGDPQQPHSPDIYGVIKQPNLNIVEKPGGEWKLKKGFPVRVKTDPTNELRVAKRVNVEFPLQDFVANASHARLPLLTNPTKGSSMDVPSSFSEDETAETSSSSG